MNIEDNKLKQIIEAALMSVAKPMSIDQLLKLFIEFEQVSASKVKEAIKQLQNDCEGRGIELADVASGYRYQARQGFSEWLSRLWEERPAKYSRAALETLALIAYRQPVTRAEIEDVRGVGVSSSIIKTLMERDWIRIVGHRDVPGRPALYATAKQFLDYFNMKSLEDLPTLSEIKDLEDINPELELPNPDIHEDEYEEIVSDLEVDSEQNLDSDLDSDSERQMEIGAGEALESEAETDFVNKEVNAEETNSSNEELYEELDDSLVSDSSDQNTI